MGNGQKDDFGNRKDERRGLRAATKGCGRLLAEGCSHAFEHCAWISANRGGNGVEGKQEDSQVSTAPRYLRDVAG